MKYLKDSSLKVNSIAEELKCKIVCAESFSQKSGWLFNYQSILLFKGFVIEFISKNKSGMSTGTS